METHLRDLATRQACESSVDVVVANQANTTEASEVDGVHILRLARVMTIASMPVCPGLLGAVRRHPSDIVHIHTPNPASALAFLVSGHNGKLIVTHHADTLGRKVLRRLSDPFAVRLMRRADRIIVTSRGYLRSSVELRPFQDKCRIVPLGVDLHQISVPDARRVREIRERFGDRVVLAVGRLVPYKGFDVLIQSLRTLDARLLIIGDGPQAASLAALARSAGVGGRVSILRWVDDLASYFEASAVFVLPSINRAEAFGLVQLEAMAAGIPVVNTSLDTGVPEVSLDRQTGLTVPPRNVGALAGAISLLLDRPDLRALYGANGRARVHTEFSADLMVARTMELYREVLDQPALSRRKCIEVNRRGCPK